MYKFKNTEPLQCNSEPQCHQETGSTSLGNSWHTSLKVKLACYVDRDTDARLCRENRRKAYDDTSSDEQLACVYCKLELDCIVNSCTAEITLQMCSVQHKIAQARPKNAKHYLMTVLIRVGL